MSSDWPSAYLRDRGIRCTIPQKPSVHRTTALDAQRQRRGCPRTRGRFDATHDPKVPVGDGTPLPDLLRSRALCEYAERAGTRTQIICARASSRRAVGIAPDGRVWRPPVIGVPTHCRLHGEIIDEPGVTRAAFEMASRVEASPYRRSAPFRGRHEGRSRPAGPVAMAGLHAVEAVATLGWDRRRGADDRVHPARAEARHPAISSHDRQDLGSLVLGELGRHHRADEAAARSLC